MNLKPCIILFLFISFSAFIGCNTKNESIKGSEKTVPGETEDVIPGSAMSIHEAALTGQMTRVNRLLEMGLDVNKRDEDGRTALMYASFNGHAEIIKKLIERGAQVNLRDNYGRTALMMASSGPYPVAVKILLDHQADPNIPDTEEHFTALMYAAAEGHLDVVRVLLAGRADPLLKDIDGDDALTFATNNGHQEIAALLKSFEK